MSDDLANQKSGLLKNWRFWGPYILLCLMLAVALVLWPGSLIASGPRAFLAFLAAGFVLWFSFPGRRSVAGANSASVTNDASLDESYVRNFIAYDAIVFTVIGLATAVAATPQWETAILLSGASLLIGAFFGLLFGYPQGVVAQTAAAQPGQKTNQSGGTTPQNTPPAQETLAPHGTPGPQDTPQQATKDKNLIAESASTLGKVIAGFTLAKADNIAGRFHHICETVGPALSHQQFAQAHSVVAQADAVLAGSIILYFFATGFFSGLLLPPYFMSGKI